MATGQGAIRNGRQAFCRGFSGWQLESLDGKGEALAELIDCNYRIVAPCSMGYYENELGGRVAVSGYFATAKSFVLHQNQADEESVQAPFFHDALTAYVDSCHRVGLWVRNNDGHIIATMVNASMDPAENLELMIKAGSCHARLTGMHGDESEVSGQPEDAGYVWFLLPALPPWASMSFDNGRFEEIILSNSQSEEVTNKDVAGLPKRCVQLLFGCFAPSRGICYPRLRVLFPVRRRPSVFLHSHLWHACWNLCAEFIEYRT